MDNINNDQDLITLGKRVSSGEATEEEKLKFIRMVKDSVSSMKDELDLLISKKDN